MPRYFLHLHNSMGFLEDEEGRDLLDLEAAREEAVRSIRSLLADEIRRGRIDLRGRLEVAGSDGEILDSIAFGQAVDVVTEEPRP
jgi:hypothetical protein